MPPQSASSTQLLSWTDDWRAFVFRHSKHPGIQIDPLYPLPLDLLLALDRHLRDWLTPDEMAWEQDLQRLCQRHHAVGIIHGRLALDLSLHRPAVPALSEDLFKKLGWDCFWTPTQARRRVATALERIDPLVERLDAYRGWLVTNPTFLSELEVLRTQWQKAVVSLGHIPCHPVQVATDLKPRRSRKGCDVTEAFAQDFNHFYDRWELHSLATWDLPQPRGFNLSGDPLPPSPGSATPITLQVSPILSLPGNYPIRTIVEEAQRSQAPAHLHGWCQVQRQQHANDLGFQRFRRIFLLYFYRDTVLASRYGQRFAGHVESLDRVFGDYLGQGQLGEDSIKKLRQQMAALRNRKS